MAQTIPQHWAWCIGLHYERDAQHAPRKEEDQPLNGEPNDASEHPEHKPSRAASSE